MCSHYLECLHPEQTRTSGQAPQQIVMDFWLAARTLSSSSINFAPSHFFPYRRPVDMSLFIHLRPQPRILTVHNAHRVRIARRNYAIQAPGAPTVQVFNRHTKWLQKERAAKDVEGSRNVDYLRDEAAFRLSERLLVRITLRQLALVAQLTETCSGD